VPDCECEGQTAFVPAAGMQNGAEAQGVQQKSKFKGPRCDRLRVRKRFAVALWSAESVAPEALGICRAIWSHALRPWAS
jgi:hypothetical protein